MITKKERQLVEKAARALYQDVVDVEIKEDPTDESSLLLTVVRGVRMPELVVDRVTATPRKSKVSKKV